MGTRCAWCPPCPASLLARLLAPARWEHARPRCGPLTLLRPCLAMDRVAHRTAARAHAVLSQARVIGLDVEWRPGDSKASLLQVGARAPHRPLCGLQTPWVTPTTTAPTTAQHFSVFQMRDACGTQRTGERAAAAEARPGAACARAYAGRRSPRPTASSSSTSSPSAAPSPPPPPQPPPPPPSPHPAPPHQPTPALQPQRNHRSWTPPTHLLPPLPPTLRRRFLRRSGRRACRGHRRHPTPSGPAAGQGRRARRCQAAAPATATAPPPLRSVSRRRLTHAFAPASRTRCAPAFVLLSLSTLSVREPPAQAGVGPCLCAALWLWLRRAATAGRPAVCALGGLARAHARTHLPRAHAGVPQAGRGGGGRPAEAGGKLAARAGVWLGRAHPGAAGPVGRLPGAGAVLGGVCV